MYFISETELCFQLFLLANSRPSLAKQQGKYSTLFTTEYNGAALFSSSLFALKAFLAKHRIDVTESISFSYHSFYELRSLFKLQNITKATSSSWSSALWWYLLPSFHVSVKISSQKRMYRGKTCSKHIENILAAKLQQQMGSPLVNLVSVLHSRSVNHSY